MILRILCACFAVALIPLKSFSQDRILLLNNKKQLEIFQPDGSKVGSVSLAAPPRRYLSMTVGDLIVEHKGLEIGILREDEYIDIYPYPEEGVKLLKRLKYVKLIPVAGRKSIAVTSSNVNPAMAGDELVLLQAAEKNNKTQYVYVYSLANGKSAENRIAYWGLNSLHLPLVSIDLSKENGQLLSVAKDGFLELFKKSSKVWQRAVTSAFGKDKTSAVSARYWRADASVLLESGVINKFQGIKKSSSTKLKTVSLPVDYAVVSAPPVDRAPVKEVSWKNHGISNMYKECAWNKLNSPIGKLVMRETPDGSSEVLELLSPSNKLEIPLNIQLPAGCDSIGMWFDGTRRVGADFITSIRKHVSYVLRIGQRVKVIAAESIVAPGNVPLNGRLHPQARYGDWIQWKVFWDNHGKLPVVLESIRITGGAKRRVMLGPLTIGINDIAPFRSESVWKLKNFSFQKPWSTHWTAGKFHEYFYKGNPFLRPVIWKKYNPKSIIAVLKKPNGEPLAAYKITDSKLSKDFMLPDLPEGSYFVDLSMLGNNHRLITQDRVVVQKLIGKKKLQLPELDRNVLPCVISGFSRNGATEVREGLNVQVKLSPDLKKRTALVVWALADSEDMIITSDKISAGNSDEINIKLNPARAGGYQFTLKFYSPEGVLLYSSKDIFGLKTVTEKLPENGICCKEDGNPKLLSSAKVIFDTGQTHRLPQYTLPSLVSAAVRGKNIPVLNINWFKFEPVKGVYNFQLVDRMLDLGSFHGTTPWIGITFGGDNVPEWLWFDELMSQDNRTIHLDYHYVNPMGRKFSEAHRKLYKLLFERYKNDPRLGGWFFFAGPSEGFLTDTYPLICGYSSDARERFRTWLMKRYNNLSALNKSWKTGFSDWSKVNPPYPDFDKGWEDSPQWRDFTEFKQAFVVTRLRNLHKMLREIDPKRPALMFAKEGFGATGALAPSFKKYNVRYSNGGGETFMSYVQSCIMNNFGVPVTCEGHYVMPNSGSVFCVLANSILAGHFGGNNIQWGLVWAKKAHDGMPETKLIMKTTRAVDAESKELVHTVQASPVWAGYFSATNSLYSKREFRLKQNPCMNNLHEAAQYVIHAQESWVDDYCTPDILAKYPVIIDGNSKIMKEGAIDNIVKYIGQGGTLIASISMGEFMPGKEHSVFQLARRLKVNGKIRRSRIDSANSLINGNSVVQSEVYEISDIKNSNLKSLAKDQAGRDVIWSLEYGKGRVIFTAGVINFVKSAEWLRSILCKYSGKSPFSITSSALCQAGVVKNKDYYFIVVRPLAPGKSQNASISQMKAEKMVEIKIQGKGLGNTVEILKNTSMIYKDGELKLKSYPGFLSILKVPRIR